MNKTWLETAQISGKRARSLLVSTDGDGDHDGLMTSVTVSPCCGLQGFYFRVEADHHQSSSKLELRIMTILSSCALLPAQAYMMSEVFIYMTLTLKH